MSINTDNNALDDYLSFEEENPFGEEFDKDDLVVSMSDEELKKKEEPFIDFEFEDPKPVIDYQPESESGDSNPEDSLRQSESAPKRLELEDIMNYNEDLHQKNAFKFDLGAVEDLTPEEEKMQNDFRDVIEYRRISGRTRGLKQPNVIPISNIVSKSDSVEIKDVHGFSTDEHPLTSQILTHLNDQGEISVIEVICNCGNRTVIRLDYTEEEPETNNLDEYYSQE